MKLARIFVAVAMIAALSAALISLASTSRAASADPLFINLTSDDGHRVNMALSFGMKQLDRGHALTIFLNDKGVLVGSTKNAEKFAEQQKTIAALVEKGAVVFICPMCMEHYGVVKADILPGLKVSDPDAIGEYLFKENTKTMSW